MSSNVNGAGYSSFNKYKLKRRGRKLQATDDQRILVALPKDVAERTWAEVLQKEEEELFIFELREDIVEAASCVVYARYMEKQAVLFTAHCAAQAWLKIIDWHFYRHDPGEEPSAYPLCHIPKREESWIPDELPTPSPKDSWCRHELDVVEDITDEPPLKSSSSTSLEIPVLEEIPSEYWFPGKIIVPESMQRKRLHHNQKSLEDNESGTSTLTPTSTEEDRLIADSEVLQRVTDYNAEEQLSATVSGYSALKATPVDGLVHGAGDLPVDRLRPRLRQYSEKSKGFSKASVMGRSRGLLPPLQRDSPSRISIISDCRLRSLRLDTQYEVSPEKMDTPPGVTSKRK